MPHGTRRSDTSAGPRAALNEGLPYSDRKKKERSASDATNAAAARRARRPSVRPQQREREAGGGERDELGVDPGQDDGQKGRGRQRRGALAPREP